MIAEIHVAPNPPGTAESQYHHVKAAIAEIQKSGLRFEVGALGTTIEGSSDQVWPLLRRVHEATLQSGAVSVITNIRFAERSDDDGPGMSALVAPYRD